MDMQYGYQVLVAYCGIWHFCEYYECRMILWSFNRESCASIHFKIWEKLVVLAGRCTVTLRLGIQVFSMLHLMGDRLDAMRLWSGFHVGMPRNFGWRAFATNQSPLTHLLVRFVVFSCHSAASGPISSNESFKVFQHSSPSPNRQVSSCILLRVWLTGSRHLAKSSTILWSPRSLTCYFITWLVVFSNK